MPPIHLSDFRRDKLSYSENNRRFCLKGEKGTQIQAFNIDVAGPGWQYFKEVYKGASHQGHRSADGIYIGSFQQQGKKIYFVLVIELEGHTSFEDSTEQVKSTLEHFYINFQDDTLDDDGVRHHEQAQHQTRPYLLDRDHLVAGIVIGSTARQGTLSIFREWPIICLNSRQPVQDKTPIALFEEISKYTGQRYW